MEQMNADGLDTIPIDYEEGGWPKNAQTFRPVVYRDGNAFCCLLGPDPQAGIFGCGNTALEAVMDWEHHLQKRLSTQDMPDEVAQYVLDTLQTSKKDVG